MRSIHNQANSYWQSIQELLTSAGLAFKTLTAAKAPAQDGVSPKQARRDAFTNATDLYLNSLHSVDVRMKRQANGLAESGIMAMDRPDDVDTGGPSGFSAAEQARSKDKVGLDVGWLNSRSGKVGRDMDAELWSQAQALMDKRKYKSNGHGDGAAKEDEDMD